MIYASVKQKLLPCLVLTMLAVASAATLPVPARAQVIESTSSLTVEINKGKLFKLPHVATAVVIANPEIADVQVVSPGLVYINGKSVGETSVFAVDGQDNQVLNATVTVTHNLSKLAATLKNSMPDVDVKFSSTDGALVIDGNVDSPIQAESVRKLATPFLQKDQTLVNMLHIAGSDQVMLQVKVAEVSRSELKRFGIHLENLFNTGNFVFGLAQGRDIVDNVTGNVTRNGLDSSVYTGYHTGSTNINAIIDALQDEGLVTTLAEPNLTTTSGQPANFLAGGEFPIPSVDSDGQVSVEYRPYGVTLNFTPTVLEKNKISLNVTPEVSELTDIGSVNVNGFSIPALATRRASATVELGSGQSFAIAGLLQNKGSNTVSKFPGLGDIPVLGALFRSSQFQHDQSELVIIITPYVVHPSSEKLATPLDGYVPPTDWQRVLFGTLYQQQTADNNAAPTPTLQGPAGFILK